MWRRERGDEIIFFISYLQFQRTVREVSNSKTNQCSWIVWMIPKKKLKNISIWEKNQNFLFVLFLSIKPLFSNLVEIHSLCERTNPDDSVEFSL